MHYPREDGSQITYYLTENKSDRLLVLIQGSDCNSLVDNLFFDEIFVQVLPGADILAVEKYGIDATLPLSFDEQRDDCPQAYMENDSPSQRVSDYMTLINELRQKNQYTAVILLGGSEGALVANLIAAQASYIDATIALNAGGDYLADDIIHNIRSEVPGDLVEQVIQEFKQFEQQILQNKWIQTNESDHGFKWWQEVLSISQFKVLSEIKSPVLIIQTLADQSVDPAQVIAMIGRLGNQHNITFYAYPELDHSFSRNGEFEIEEIIEDIKTWLSMVLK